METFNTIQEKLGWIHFDENFRKVYMHITYTFMGWKPQWPPQQPQSETRTSGRGGWQSPSQCWSLHLRSWPWGMPGCFEGVYWPLYQLRSTWNNLKGWILLSWEATFPSTSVPSGRPSASPGCAWQWGNLHGQNTACAILFVFPSCLKFFSSEKKNYLVWIRWFFSGAQRF